MIKYPKSFNYKIKFRNMEDVYRHYRTISHDDEYKSHSPRQAYGGIQKTPKTDYSSSRHLQARSDDERIEHQPPKFEQKTEIKNDEQTGHRQLPIVELGEKKFFLDERLQELRDVEDFRNSISFKDLDLVPEKTEPDGRYDIERQADVKDIFNLPKYENAVEFGQNNALTRKRPSPYEDRLE